LTCCQCDAAVAKASELLLQNDAEHGSATAEWAGRLWGLCQACSHIDSDKAFKKASDASWLRRRRELGTVVRRARDIDFHDSRHVMVLAFPGASRARLRLLTILRLQVIATRMSLDSNEHCRTAAGEITRVYLEELDSVAFDPESKTTSTGWTLKSEEAGYLTNITKTVTLSFMCRHTDCLFFGMNDQWIKNVNSEHFRCPQCGHNYMPWKAGLNLHPAQKVLTVTNPLSGHIWCFPCTWAETREANWLNMMAEVEARNIETGADLTALMNKSAVSLSDFLARVAVPTCFTKLEWKPEIEYMLDSGKFPRTQWEHLKESGVHGMKLTFNPEQPDVFDSWPELIGMLAKVMAGAQAIGAKL